jgi:hypothetical protein
MPQLTPASSTTRVLPRAISRGRSWHNNVDDRLTRKLMMLRLRRLHPVLAGAKCTAASSSGSSIMVPSLVQRLEWMLYNAAHSMHEYTHEQSLERRVQALVTQLESKGTAERRQQAGVSNSKRYRVAGDEVDPGPDKKRRRRDDTQDSVVDSSNRFTGRSVFLMENDDNLVGLVLSFLSGRTVLRLRSVNRFMLENAPTMVSTLHLETHSPALQHFASGTLTALLLRCSNLTSLVVTSKLRARGSDESTDTSNRHRRPSFSRPSHRDGGLQSLLAGELVLRDITRAFERGACPALQELDLGSPLDYFAESDDVLSCLEAFAAGRRRQARPVTTVEPLQYLRLDSTYLGDARLSRLADVFERAGDPNCFRSLKMLVLRNNFIGEAGCQALLRMLCCLPALRVLDVSGNILTDLDALAIADWISCRADDLNAAVSHRHRVHDGCCSLQESKRPSWRTAAAKLAPAVQIRTLLLQDNFIGQEGLEALSAALNARLIPS